MEALIATLEREADERCAAMLADAAREAERLRRAGESRFAQRREEATAALEEELRRRGEAAEAAARAKTRTVLLRARRSVLRRVFRRARTLLPEATRTEAWASSIASDLRQALDCLGDTDVVVVCPVGLGEALRTAASESARRIRVQELEDAPPGFEVRGVQTDVRVDVTLPTRLAFRQPELEMGVLAKLEERR